MHGLSTSSSGRGCAISISEVAFDNPRQPGAFLVSTWSTGSFGTYRSDTKSSEFLSSITPHIDSFIDKYLWVNNEAACEEVQKNTAAKRAAMEAEKKKTEQNRINSVLMLLSYKILQGELGPRLAEAAVAGDGLTLTAEEVASWAKLLPPAKPDRTPDQAGKNPN